MRAILDRVLEKGTNPDGLLYNAVNPRTGEVLDKGLADTWGYVYNAFLTIAAIDNEPRYREAAQRALAAISKYEGYDWENGSADGYADSIESALNLLARIPSDAASGWVDKSMEFLFGKQRPDGILEGWHGDGNSARTALMWALAKTQGVAASPWRDDLKLGAVRLPDGGVRIVLAGDWPWSGTLRFDRPRHRVRMYLPFDYPRINQFPEWFTADATGDYEITIGEGPARVVKGHDLYELPLKVKAGETLRLTVKPYRDPAAPKLRTMKYTPRSPRATVAWQKDLRGRLFKLLAMSDQVGAKVPLDARVLSSEERDGYVFEEVELNSTPGRRIKAVVTVPRSGAAPYPAVVAIHGHGGSRFIVHDRSSVYKGFAAELAGIRLCHHRRRRRPARRLRARAAARRREAPRPHARGRLSRRDERGRPGPDRLRRPVPRRRDGHVARGHGRADRRLRQLGLPDDHGPDGVRSLHVLEVRRPAGAGRFRRHLRDDRAAAPAVPERPARGAVHVRRAAGPAGHGRDPAGLRRPGTPRERRAGHPPRRARGRPAELGRVLPESGWPSPPRRSKEIRR